MSFDLLDAFAQKLRRWGLPGHPEALTPGLSDDEIDSLMEVTGVRLPEEAELCGVGATVNATVRSSTRMSGFFPLSNAIELQTFQRELAADFAQPEDWWPESYFPIFESEPVLAIDCNARPGSRSAVHHTGVDEDRKPRISRPETASIG